MNLQCPEFIVDDRRIIIRRLKSARTLAEVAKILSEAGWYDGVDPEQRGKWHRVADKRRKEIGE